MPVRRLFVMLCVVSATLLSAVACVPAAQPPDSVGASAPATDTETDTANETEAETETETVTSEVNTGEEENAVDSHSKSDESLASTPPGHADPSAAGEGSGVAPRAAGGDSQTEPYGSGEQLLAGEMVVYTDSVYAFSVAYPADYVFRTVPAEKLAPLDPQPVASFVLMNPTLASSDIAELELPDLEIRVFHAEGAASLQDWLAAHGFTAEDGYLPTQSFQTANVTGLKVCASTMLAPGCSYFVWGDSWVYQMVPASIEGETIMNSFALVR